MITGGLRVQRVNEKRARKRGEIVGEGNANTPVSRRARVSRLANEPSSVSKKRSRATHQCSSARGDDSSLPLTPPSELARGERRVSLLAPWRPNRAPSGPERSHSANLRGSGLRLPSPAAPIVPVVPSTTCRGANGSFVGRGGIARTPMAVRSARRGMGARVSGGNLQQQWRRRFMYWRPRTAHRHAVVIFEMGPRNRSTMGGPAVVSHAAKRAAQWEALRAVRLSRYPRVDGPVFVANGSATRVSAWSQPARTAERGDMTSTIFLEGEGVGR